MTYFAPRQGLFAVIILVSISLHLLFFVIAQDYTLSQQRNSTAQHRASLIAKDIAVSLNAQDRVGISIIASAYLKDGQVNFIGVYDSSDNLIVPTGKESTQDFIAKEPITLNNQVLGSVAVHAHAINRAEIISLNWAFLVAMFALHVIIYLIYGYIARPSQNMLKKITEDVRLRLVSAEILPATSAFESDSTKITPLAPKPTQQEAEAELKTETDTPADEPTPEVVSEPAPAKSSQIMVQIQFDDTDGLMSTVSHHTKSAYFSLCTQLLTKAVEKTLTLPVLSGVSVLDIEDYSEKGATVIFKADNPHGKVATTAMMLAKLMTILHQIVYDKHRELRRFGLPARAMVSDIEHRNHVLKVANKHKERVLILLGESDLNQLQVYSELGKLTNPITIHEREARWLKALSESTAQRIKQVRDKVLLED